MMIDNIRKMDDNELNEITGGAYIENVEDKELFTPELTPDYEYLPMNDSTLEEIL